MIVILLITFLTVSNCIKVVEEEEQNLNGGQWGFTKNIINIDTFFKSDPDAIKKKMSPEEKQKLILAEK